MIHHKLGRVAGHRHPALPRMAAFLSTIQLPKLPQSQDWYSHIKTWPMLMNDTIGDCVVSDALISGPKQTAAYRALFSGDVVTFTLASGKKLAVTPNHQMLTDRGFVAAKFVKNGDNLISTSGTEVLPRAAFRGREADLDDAPATAAQKFESLTLSRAPAVKVMPVPVHFHGDGQFIHGDIDVVAPYGFLGSDPHPFLSKPDRKDQIGAASKLEGSLHGAGPSLERSVASLRSPNGDVGFGGERAALGERHPRVSQSDSLQQRAQREAALGDRGFEPPSGHAAFPYQRLQRLAGNVAFDPRRQISMFAPVEELRGGISRPKLNASLVKPSHDGFPTDPHIVRDFLERLSGFVAADRVVNVESQSFAGHVYDFSTEPQWYVANGVVTHNCTIASVGHMVQQESWLTGHPLVMTDAEALAGYEAVTGYKPDDPATDTGAYEGDVGAYWLKTGFKCGGQLDQIAGFADINVKNLDELRYSVFLTGNCFLGFTLPACAEEDPVWDLPTTPEAGEIVGGHAVPVVGYDQKYFYVVSWGAIVPVTYPFIQKYLDEGHVTLSHRWMTTKGLTPGGINWNQLIADTKAFCALAA